MCNCINEVNEILAKQNTKLLTYYLIRSNVHTVTIGHEKIDKKKREMTNLLPSYCPFCGKKYSLTPVQ